MPFLTIKERVLNDPFGKHTHSSQILNMVLDQVSFTDDLSPSLDSLTVGRRFSRCNAMNIDKREELDA